MRIYEAHDVRVSIAGVQVHPQPEQPEQPRGTFGPISATITLRMGVRAQGARVAPRCGSSRKRARRQARGEYRRRLRAFWRAMISG